MNATETLLIVLVSIAVSMLIIGATIIHVARFDHVSAKLKSVGIEFRANVRN